MKFHFDFFFQKNLLHQKFRPEISDRVIHYCRFRLNRAFCDTLVTKMGATVKSIESFGGIVKGDMNVFSEYYHSVNFLNGINTMPLKYLIHLH